jgi:site-specific recombinase XerD
LEYVRSFFRFCHQSGWMTANPAAVIKPPKPDHSRTLPFEQKQIDAMLPVADAFTREGSSAAGNAIAFAQ